MPIFATVIGAVACVVWGDFLKETGYRELAWLVWIMGFVFFVYMLTLL